MAKSSRFKFEINLKVIFFLYVLSLSIVSCVGSETISPLTLINSTELQKLIRVVSSSPDLFEVLANAIVTMYSQPDKVGLCNAMPTYMFIFSLKC